MDERTILTRQEPGIAELDNFDEIKAYLDQRLEANRRADPLSGRHGYGGGM